MYSENERDEWNAVCMPLYVYDIMILITNSSVWYKIGVKITNERNSIGIKKHYKDNFPVLFNIIFANITVGS